MAYLHRLIIFALLSVWLPTLSFATESPILQSAGGSNTAPCSNNTGWITSDVVAGNASLACRNIISPPACSFSSMSGTRVMANCAGSVVWAADIAQRLWCVEAATNPFNGVCPPPPGNACMTVAGKPAGNYSGPGGTGLHSLCDMDVNSGDPALPGCLISGNANIAYYDAPNQTYSASMTFTGGKCLPSGDSPTAPAPVGCPVGQVSGLVNGQPYCYKPDLSTTPKTTTGGGTTTTNNPDGSKTKTDTNQTTTCTAAGSCTTVTNVTTTGTTAGGTTGTPVTTTTTSTCQRGTAGCQTTATTPAPVTTTSTTTGTTTTGGTTTNTGSTSTTTSTTSGGTGGNGSASSGSGNGNGDGDGGDGGMFAGTCGAIPICDGDAIMCAVAAATFTTNCVLSDPKLPTPLYDAAITKTGDQTTDLPGNKTVNVGPSQFDQTELLGGGSGMSDQVVTVAGHSITLPFSSVNIWLARLGLVLQAVTFLVCARIVVRG